MKFIFVLIVLFFLNLTYAQQLTNYGLKIGMNLSTAKSETTNLFYRGDYRNSRLGSSIGLFTDVSFSNIFSVQFDMSYSNEGAEDKIPVTTFEKPDGTGDFFIWDREFDFLNTELLLKSAYETEEIKFYGLIGPEMKILLYERNVFIYGTKPKNFLFGYSVGFGFLPKEILNGKVFIEFKFGDSFGNLISTKDFKLKFQTFLLSLGCNVN